MVDVSWYVKLDEMERDRKDAEENRKRMEA